MQRFDSATPCYFAATVHVDAVPCMFPWKAGLPRKLYVRPQQLCNTLSVQPHALTSNCLLMSSSRGWLHRAANSGGSRPSLWTNTLRAGEGGGGGDGIMVMSHCVLSSHVQVCLLDWSSTCCV